MNARLRPLCITKPLHNLTTTARGNHHPSSTPSKTPATTKTAPFPLRSNLPFKFETGTALFAKRPPRPFPPPFLSPPSASFSDPLSTHHSARDRRPYVNGELIRGYTNGDDAVYASEIFIGANDGVGAWSTRPSGHAGLWARLVLHFWAKETESDAFLQRVANNSYRPDPISYLQKAYEQTIEATSEPNKWLGTTTAAGAQLHFEQDGDNAEASPILYVTNLGDSQILVLRPRDQEVVFKTKEQWHWFDCPRQLGTNSPDTPLTNAVMDKVPIEENDVVLAMSDGVIDNLWEHEILEVVTKSIGRWEKGEGGHGVGDKKGGAGGGMEFVAHELMKAARTIAQDPFAESPFMEHAVEEGLAMEGVWLQPCVDELALRVDSDHVSNSSYKHYCGISIEARLYYDIAAQALDADRKVSWRSSESLGARLAMSACLTQITCVDMYVCSYSQGIPDSITYEGTYASS